MRASLNTWLQLSKRKPCDVRVLFQRKASSVKSESVDVSKTTNRSSHGKARRRRSAPTESIPSMKEFLHRQTVTHQYRSFLKAVKLFPKGTEQAEAFREVKSAFRVCSRETNPISIRMAVTDVSGVFYSLVASPLPRFLNSGFNFCVPFQIPEGPEKTCTGTVVSRIPTLQ
mmetsp:Transcript_28504/g.41627  ORF Transcript_28504/g.41627 Transcript_28504/m.41627 type:complete len:171 (+) Transcript_28504:3-515(+)